jgi:hypothetical protein
VSTSKSSSASLSLSASVSTSTDGKCRSMCKATRHDERYKVRN